jgi:hypothetical protein
MLVFMLVKMRVATIYGNQSNMVNITRLKSRCAGIRRTPWKVSQPDSVRAVW